jgi:hypothetical protein
MAFRNRIRLPFQLFRPQLQSEKSVFRKSTGEVQTLNVVVRKIYQGETDLLPESIHEKLKIALEHDSVTVEGDRFMGEVVTEGDYQIAWPDFLDYPIAKGAFSAEVKAFDAVNSNCASCDEFIGLDLADDRYENAYGELIPLTEGGTYTLDVAANDTICCSPAEFSIVDFNTLYVESITIDQNGLVEFQLKTDLPNISQIALFTYRVTCPNDNYDEAVGYVAIEGTIESCEQPTAVTASVVEPTYYEITWTAPSGGTPAAGYDWELYLASDLLTVVDSGNILTEGPVELTLDASTDYVFRVRSNCDGSTSPWVDYEFTTPPQTESCGRYRVEYNDGTGVRDNFTIISYIACDGSNQQVAAYNETTNFICALQVGPGDPVSITGATIIEYFTEC